MNAGDRLTVTVEKAIAGGRMLARHEGAVVLVSGAVPGEVVEVDVERVQRGTAWACTRRVVEASSDRVVAPGDWSCGGNVLSHVRYARQVVLKRDILRDAFARIGRVEPGDIAVTPSPAQGYRMRARLHVAGRRLGFFREGTHELCDPAQTGQLLPPTLDVVRALESALASRERAGVAQVELAENCAADQRAVHLVLASDTDPTGVGSLGAIDGLTGVSCGAGRPLTLCGMPEVSDTLWVPSVAGDVAVSITRHAHAFFQGNRYLLQTLLASVTAIVPAGRVVDLYAGVGLFSVALGVRGDTEVTAVEGDRTAAHDLKRNAMAADGAIEPRHQAVEVYLASQRAFTPDTVIVDPPRTGLSREALGGVVRLAAARVVYVSCDVATLARDTRALVDAGYRLAQVRAFDLFPNTAHVETLVVFER